MIIFDRIPGYLKVKENLIKSFSKGRVSHAQIFNAPDGAPGIMLALGYLQLVFCESEKKPCGQCISCVQIENLTHPDLHFSFPYVGGDKETCEPFIGLWRSFLKENPFFLRSQWNEKLDTKNKQPQIYTAEGKRIIKSLSLKSYSGKYKVLLLWQPELLNAQSANKLLKFIEEPDPNTIILMVSHNLENVLPTVLSRCQVLSIGLLKNEQLISYLTSTGVSDQDAETLSYFGQGLIGQALSFNNLENDQKKNAILFLKWLRVCFKANPIEITQITDEISSYNRDPLKRLLIDFQSIIRTTFTIQSGSNSSLTIIDLTKIAPFITENNIENIYNAFELAIRDLVRNGSSKIIIHDLSLQMHFQLHNYKG